MVDSLCCMVNPFTGSLVVWSASWSSSVGGGWCLILLAVVASLGLWGFRSLALALTKTGTSVPPAFSAQSISILNLDHRHVISHLRFTMLRRLRASPRRRLMALLCSIVMVSVESKELVVFGATLVDVVAREISGFSVFGSRVFRSIVLV
ncbi:unnamed protein product [Linum trigynum]|uniref:Uncharacterized protein n=1 Tax=Linum trigynum TaxID=586398 RepID=A0AAV2FMS2_9ROSI